MSFIELISLCFLKSNITISTPLAQTQPVARGEFYLLQNWFHQGNESKAKTLFCLQPQLASLCATSSRGRPASCHRPLPQHETTPQKESEDQQHTHFHSQPQENPRLGGNGALPTARSGEDGSRSSTDSPSVGSIGDPGETRRTKILFVRKIDTFYTMDSQTNEWQVSPRHPS